MIRRIFLPLCVVLAVAAPAYASSARHGLRGMHGTVSSLSDDSISVSRGDRQLTCLRGMHSPALDQVAVGDQVAIVCRKRHHQLVLVGAKKLDAAPTTGDEGQRSVIAGPITVLADGSVTVHNDEGGRTLTCKIPDRFAELAKTLEVGDRIAMLCRGPKDGTLELVKLVRPLVKKGGDGHNGGNTGLTDIAGHVTAVGGGSLTIGNTDGSRTLTCTVPDALADAVAALEVGAAAQMICRNGELVVLRTGDAPPQPTPPKPAPTLQSFSYTGPVTLLSNDRVGVRVDGETRSCFVPADLRPQLTGFALEQAAVLTCQGVDAAHGALTAITHSNA
jgi:hypothetical protein